jgi:metal-sulfur cluster biosynthetic enzyme
MITDPSQPPPQSEGPAQPAGSASSAPSQAPNPADDITEDAVRLALRKVKDPELNLNIVDLGLVYNITVDEGNKVIVDMSLTSPGCPAGPQIMHDAERTVQAMPGVGKVVINLVWEPFWTPDRIEPKVRAYMGI